MQIITGFTIILIHLVAGNMLSDLAGNFIPGSIMGMLLMFLSLITGIVKDHQIRKVAVFLTDNMTVFFLPAFMGIIELWGLIRMNIVAWLAVVILTTILVFLAATYTQTGIEVVSSRRKRRGQ